LKLNLTEELLQQAHKQLQEKFRFSQGREIREEQIQQERMTNRKRLMSLLIDEQKAKWRDMAGPRFEGKLDFGPPK
jgi:hypothetical protein